MKSHFKKRSEISHLWSEPFLTSSEIILQKRMKIYHFCLKIFVLFFQDWLNFPPTPKDLESRYYFYIRDLIWEISDKNNMTLRYLSVIGISTNVLVYRIYQSTYSYRFFSELLAPPLILPLFLSTSSGARSWTEKNRCFLLLLANPFAPFGEVPSANY